MDFQVGDRVKVLILPEWLLQDLPLNEQKELRSVVGMESIVQEIDKYGYVWIGFGNSIDKDEEGFYSGHSFAIPKDCIEKLNI